MERLEQRHRKLSQHVGHWQTPSTPGAGRCQGLVRKAITVAPGCRGRELNGRICPGRRSDWEVTRIAHQARHEPWRDDDAVLLPALAGEGADVRCAQSTCL